MGKNQVLFLSQMEESKMAKQVHIRVDDDIYKELSDYSVVSGQSMVGFCASAPTHWE